jgi:hypothetical protein
MGIENGAWEWVGCAATSAALGTLSVNGLASPFARTLGDAASADAMTIKATNLMTSSARRFHRMFRMDERHVEWMLPFRAVPVCQPRAAPCVRGAHQAA